MKSYRFPCGCEWPILEENTPEGVVPLLDFDIEKASPNCSMTWELLGRGETKGVFQLESPLGKQWTKRLKPETGEHLGALGAILRPGALKAFDEEGVSMTQHYCRRKNGEEEVASFHPAVDRVLQPTYNAMIYQEQFLILARDLAGFGLTDNDLLRKAVGKKDIEKLAAIRDKFLEGCEKKGIVTKEQAETIWGWILACGRYSFNHCVSGDTVIRRPWWTATCNEPELSVETMFRIFNDASFAQQHKFGHFREKWRHNKNYGEGLSLYDNDSIAENIIVDIRYEGKRLAYRIELADGSQITVTDNHKFPTSHGIKCLRSIFRDAEYRRGNIRFYVVDETGYGKIEISLQQAVCVGEIDVYDVEMAAPYHNFVTGSGIVTCNSHAISYGLTGYDCAYIKAHFPLQFFTSWLFNARHKQDPQQERFELVNDAKLFDVVVEPPDLRSMRPHVHTDRKVVKFGITDIKGVGNSQFLKLQAAIEAATQTIGAPPAQWTWYEFLTKCAPAIPSATAKGLIQVGALRWMQMGRKEMLYQYDIWMSLTKKEQEWVQKNGGQNLLESLKRLAAPKQKPMKVRVPISDDSLSLFALEELEEQHAKLLQMSAQCVGVYESGEKIDLPDEQERGLQKEIRKNRRQFNKLTKLVEAEATQPSGGCSNEKRRQFVLSQVAMLENPPFSLSDVPAEIAYQEEELLGVSLTFHKIESCDLSQVNVTCKEFLSGRTGFLMFGVELQKVRTVKTRRGKNPGQLMAFLTIADASCALEDVVVFPDVFKEFGSLLNEGDNVIIQGERDNKKESDTLVVKKVWQATLLGN